MKPGPERHIPSKRRRNLACLRIESGILPDVLQGAIIQKDYALFLHSLACFLGHQKIEIGLVNVIALRFDRQ